MKHVKKTLLSVAIGASLSVNAQEGLEELDETTIGAQEVTEVGKPVLTSDDLVRQMTDSIEDTVRYIPGVQVNDTGNRFNDDGFNIRGLEGDFIAVTVDGVDQGETLNPPTFSPYGMFGSSRGAVEVETVKAVRITRGPNSVTDGNGALAGSVMYETKSPRDYLQVGDDAQVQVKAGFDDRSDESMISGAFANRWGQFETLLIYTRRDGHELESHSSGEDILGPERGQADPLDREETSILAKVDYYLTPDQRLGLVVEDHTREAQVTPLSRQSATYFDFRTDDTNDRDRVGLAYEWTNAGQLMFDTLLATADYQYLNTRGITRFGFSGFNGDPTDDYLRTEDRAFKQNSYTFGVDLTKSAQFGGMDHSFTYGAEYQRGDVANRLFDVRFNTLSMDSGLRSFNVDNTWVPDTDSTQFTLYARDEVALNDQWTVFGGFRYDTTEYEPEVADFFTDPTGDTVQDSDFTSTVGELGVTYSPFAGHTFGISVGQGYKAPTTQDLFLDVGSAIITDVNTGQEFIDYDEISNPNLDAEQSTNFELSYVYESPRAQVSITAFHSDYEDLIQTVPGFASYGQDVTVQQCGFGGCRFVTVDGDSFDRAENVGEVEAAGFEFDARVRLNELWTARLGYAHVSAEHRSDSPTGAFFDGEVLATESPDSAVLGVDYTAAAGNWGVSAFLTWTASRPESNDRSLAVLNNGSGPILFPESWQTLDVLGFYEFEQYGARLSVGVRNLLDEDYIRWEVINGVRPGNGGFFAGSAGNGFERFSDPGRSFSLDLSFAW
ncbi:MAG: TonB-dependent hemoglobin/transferrin/lactoferrin family receptor [Pseudomonadota bacterium]